MTKSLILFVHGIGGSPTETWGKFPELIRADLEIQPKFDVILDRYTTRVTGRVSARIGGLDLAAEGLKTRIENLYLSFDDIAVIAHSQGGLITLRYILDSLLATKPLPISRLITFATPYHGATAAGVGGFLGGVSEQAKEMAPESSFLFRLNRDWNLFRNQRSVLLKAVVAGCDGVVGAASAAGLGIPYAVASNCNHETIAKPTLPGDEIFIITKRFLLSMPTAERSRATLLARALKLPGDVRENLTKGWRDLEQRRLEDTNDWREEWNVGREQVEGAFARAAEDGMAESWRAVTNSALDLRDMIRAQTEDELDLPRYYLALVLFTDTIEKSLRIAGTLPGNLVPPEQDELISRIEKLESQVDEERVALKARTEHSSGDLSQITLQRVQQLEARLNDAERELAYSRNKAAEIESTDLVDGNASPIVELVREALEALKQGISQLDDRLFSSALRKGAKVTWLAAKRYARSMQRRFAALKLTWEQDGVFEEFENFEPTLNLDTPSYGDIIKNFTDKKYRENQALLSNKTRLFTELSSKIIDLRGRGLDDLAKYMDAINYYLKSSGMEVAIDRLMILDDRFSKSTTRDSRAIAKKYSEYKDRGTLIEERIGELEKEIITCALNIADNYLNRTFHLDLLEKQSWARVLCDFRATGVSM